MMPRVQVMYFFVLFLSQVTHTCMMHRIQVHMFRHAEPVKRYEQYPKIPVIKGMP